MFEDHLRSRIDRRRIIAGTGSLVAATAGTRSGVSASPAILRNGLSTSNQDVTELTFWVISSFTPDETAKIYEAVARYKEQTGITVTIESEQATALREKLVTAVLGGEGPDIVSIDSAWVAGLGAAEILTDISEKFSPIADQFFEGAVASGSYLDVQYAAPWYTNNVALYWNKAMFTAAGLSAPPTDWASLVEYGKKLTSGETYGLMLGSKGFGAFGYFPFAWQNGTTLISEDGKSALFGEAPGLEAWEFVSGLYLTEKIVPEDIKSATEAWDQVFAPFIQQRTAMMMSGDWAIFALTDGAPDLDYGIAPLPIGKEQATVLGGYNLGVTASSEKGDAAWEFINWLIAVEQEDILQGYNRIQARTDIVGSEYAETTPNLKVFVDQAQFARARATVPAWNDIEQTILGDAWDATILGASSPADSLAQAVGQSNEVLNEG